MAFYTGLIFWLSSGYRPIPGMRYFEQMDRLYHLAEYGPYGWFWIRAVRGTFPKLSGFQLLAVALAGASLIGGLDEYFQSFVPMKFSSAWDWLFDTMGAAVGLWIYRWRSARTP